MSRVRISFDVDVDLEAWAEEYGIEGEPHEVADDLNAYAREALVSHLHQLGLGDYWTTGPRK